MAGSCLDQNYDLRVVAQCTPHRHQHSQHTPRHPHASPSQLLCTHRHQDDPRARTARARATPCICLETCQDATTTAVRMIRDHSLMILSEMVLGVVPTEPYMQTTMDTPSTKQRCSRPLEPARTQPRTQTSTLARRTTQTELHSNQRSPCCGCSSGCCEGGDGPTLAVAAAVTPTVAAFRRWVNTSSMR